MAKKMRLNPLFKLKNPPQDHPVNPKIIAFGVGPTSATDYNRTIELSSSSSPAGVSSLSALAQEYSGDEAEVVENVIRGVRSSDRLFFTPEKSNSVLENTKEYNKSGPNIIDMESRDPYMDFRTSMEEMVEAHQLCDWELLEDLLGCYLMVNEKKNHFYIIRAFVDLVINSSFLLSLSSSSSSSSACRSPSAVSDSFFTSSSSPLHLSSSSTTAGTSSSSSLAPHDRGRRDCRIDKASHS